MKIKHIVNSVCVHREPRSIQFFLLENEPQKPKNLKKMLRKSPDSNA